MHSIAAGMAAVGPFADWLPCLTGAAFRIHGGSVGVEVAIAWWGLPCFAKGVGRAIVAPELCSGLPWLTGVGTFGLN